MDKLLQQLRDALGSYKDKDGNMPFCTVIMDTLEGDVMFTFSENSTDYLIVPKSMHE